MRGTGREPGDCGGPHRGWCRQPERAREDYLYWQVQGRKTLARINHLICGVQRDPVAGIGKPEPLKHALGGYWSRRITDEHRLVYKIQGDALWIAQVRYHY